MPQYYVTATLLLACLLGSGAHAATLRPTGEWDGHNPVVTSLPSHKGVVRGAVRAVDARPPATLPLTEQKASLLAVERQQRAGRDDRDSVNGRQPQRVVQDWSLVCQQQLCGAVAAGQPCSPPPPAAAAAADANRATGLRSPMAVMMCRELCRLQNGLSVCRCPETQRPQDLQFVQLPAEESLRERLDCKSLCALAMLMGASFNGDNCLQQLNSQAPVRSPLPVASSNGLWSHLVRVLQQTRSEGEADSVDHIVEIPIGDRQQLQEGRDTDSLGEAATFGDGTDDEPDWDELCVALCKTGDGGSLCSCDLSPFF